VIGVSRRKSRLTISSDLTNKVYYTDSHYLYGYATLISVSQAGAYFAIDFAFGLTRVYQVALQAGIPVGAKFVSEFGLAFGQMSSVSGRDWVCATAAGKALVLWDIVRGTVHRRFAFDDAVSAVAVDEANYCVWVAAGRKIVCLGLNGFRFGEIAFGETVTALTPIEGELAAICGTEIGGLRLVRYVAESGVMLAEAIESRHRDRVEKIVIQRELKRYITVDAAGGVFHWSPHGIPETEMEARIFASCAVCTNPTQTICQFCNKAICCQCFPNHLKGPDCRHCLAFM
jgi:hypothetical protein